MRARRAARAARGAVRHALPPPAGGREMRAAAL